MLVNTLAMDCCPLKFGNMRLSNHVTRAITANTVIKPSAIFNKLIDEDVESEAQAISGAIKKLKASK
jgi:hypothetical protein